MADSGIQHVVSSVPVPRSEYEDEEHHALIHGTSYPSSPVERQLYYRDDLHTWYIYNGSAWVSLQAAAIDKLNDIGDVSVPSPTDGYILYWDNATKLWKCKAPITTFLGLSDTPSSYSGQAKKPVRVNAAANALEFGSAGQVLKVFSEPKQIWRFPAIGDTNRTATVSSVAGDVITLTANVADQFFTDDMEGFAYLLIRNTTRSENAWVKAYVAANQLQVTDAADISGWQNGDSIRGHSENHPSATQFTDIDLTPSVGVNAKVVIVYTFVKDTAADSWNIIFGAAGNIAVITQVANVYCIATGFMTLYPGRQLAIKTTAADAALESIIDCQAYTEEL